MSSKKITKSQKKPKSSISREPSSFRDPSGFVFVQDEVLYRQINTFYKTDYDFFVTSGLYDHLVKNKKIVSHEEIPKKQLGTKTAYKVIRPKTIPVISYPYEWSFSQLKQAAILTLEIHLLALKHDMILKDASAYNVQFIGTQPVFIDTLSFEKYTEGEPWIAYRQFCKHFLAPLALMKHGDLRLNSMLRTYIDGIPLDMASPLLPLKTKTNFGLLTHIHMNASSQKVFSQQQRSHKKITLSKQAHVNLVTNLKNTVESLSLDPRKTEWGNYYQETNYSDTSFSAKQGLVKKFLNQIKPDQVLDLGANTGVFTEIANTHAKYVISADIDPVAVEKNFQTHSQYTSILPLVIDLTNPSPDIGWSNQERSSFTSRVKSDCVLALALIHHLAIANNIPFDSIARYLKDIAETLIIEFVPKEDSQTQKLLSHRQDIFDTYTQESFENAFKKYFTILETEPVKDSLRYVYLMRKR